MVFVEELSAVPFSLLGLVLAVFPIITVIAVSACCCDDEPPQQDYQPVSPSTALIPPLFYTDGLPDPLCQEDLRENPLRRPPQ